MIFVICVLLAVIILIKINPILFNLAYCYFWALIGLGFKALLYEQLSPDEYKELKKEKISRCCWGFLHYAIVLAVFCIIVYFSVDKFFERMNDTGYFYLLTPILFGYSGIAIDRVMNKIRGNF